MRRKSNRQAVQFGAGSIGRGFLGQLLFEGGYRTTFVDVDPVLVEALNRRGQYPLRLAGGAGEDAVETRIIGNLRALDVGNQPAVTQAILEADLISLAVGARNLPLVAPSLAAGLNARAAAGCGPIDVLLCENQWHAASLMLDLLLPHLAPEAHSYFETRVGLLETVIGRMVPAPTEALRAEDPLLIVAEPYKELPVARAALRAPVPKLPGLVLAERFEAYEARKLYLHNMGHAALAYLGHARGQEYIWQCVADDAVREVCAEAMGNVSQALALEYGFGPGLLSAFAEDLMHRFANRALGDTVARVAADPVRKLGPQDRLVGAANLCLRHGIPPRAMARVIAAALRYDDPRDEALVTVQRQLRDAGMEATLGAICGLETDSPLLSLILTAAA